MSGKLTGAIWKSRPETTKTRKAIYARMADACDDAGQPLKHLTIAEIAEDLGCDASTVSRAIRFGHEVLGILEPNTKRRIGGNRPVRTINVDKVLALIPEELRPRDLNFHPLNEKSYETRSNGLLQRGSNATASAQDDSRSGAEHNKEQPTKYKAAPVRNRQAANRARASAAKIATNVATIDGLMDYLVTGSDLERIEAGFADPNFLPGNAEHTVSSYINNAFAERTGFFGKSGMRVERLLAALNGYDATACRDRCVHLLDVLKRANRE